MNVEACLKRRQVDPHASQQIDENQPAPIPMMSASMTAHNLLRALQEIGIAGLEQV